MHLSSTSASTSGCVVQVVTAEALVNTSSSNSPGFNASGLEPRVTAAQSALTAPANHTDLQV